MSSPRSLLIVLSRLSVFPFSLICASAVALSRKLACRLPVRAFSAIWMVFVVAPLASAMTLSGWTPSDIGGATDGSDSYDPNTGTFVLTGNGVGIGTQGDQLKFTSTNVVGNFQFTARVINVSGSIPGFQGGVLVRQNPSGTCAYASGVGFIPNVNVASGSTPTRPNSIGFYTRKSTALQDKASFMLNPTDMTTSGTTLSPTKNCWLRITRIGNDLAVYKSSDNSHWSTVYNTSGNAFVESGTVQVGLYVASGTAAGAATLKTAALFDNVSLIKDPKLPYESSWIGNTFEAASTGYVSGNAKAMWVTPDGVCYVNGAGDEAGQSAKIYQSGTIVKRVDNPPVGGGWEGSITGNYVGSGTGTIFLTGQGGLYMTDLNGSNAIPMYLSDPPTFDGAGNPRVSGLAYGYNSTLGSNVLYISNPVTKKIYISGTTRNSYGRQENDMNNVVFSGTISTDGLTSPAPQKVYQSQFSGGALAFTFSSPDIARNTPYHVRLHFAEFVLSGTLSRSMTIRASGLPDTNLVLKNTGTAYIQDLDNVTSDGGGNISIKVLSNISKVDAILNGVEIRTSGVNETPVLFYNCGGPDVPDGSEIWLSSINNDPAKNLDFSGAGISRPGPLAVDKRGYLWVVQEGGDFPTSTGLFAPPPGQAFIKCFDGAGNFLNHTITGLTNPTALCYDGSNDRLFVAENGEDQNIKIYTNLMSSATVACTGTFGAKKGVFSGSIPGLAVDPTDHGSARFYGPTGVGLDRLGRLYVVCNSGPNVTNLKAFAFTSTTSVPDETLLWKLEGMEFCNVGDFDASANSSDIWTPSYHYAMDYSGSTPGSEWKLKSYLWNPFLITGTFSKAEPRAAGATAVLRKLTDLSTNGGTHKFYMYTSGQGSLMYADKKTGVLTGMDLFRFQGEQLIRSGEIVWTGSNHSLNFWSDTNGNGMQDEDRTTFRPHPKSQGNPTCFDVGDDGSVYFAMAATGTDVPTLPYVYKIGCEFKGGIPVYTGSAAGTKLFMLSSGTSTVVSGTTFVGPSQFAGAGWGGTKAHLRYFSSSDTMFLEGEYQPDAGGKNADGTLKDKNFGGFLECWDHWSTAPNKRWGIRLPDPSTEPNFQNGAPPYNQPDGFCYEAMDVANDYTFISDNWGSIIVVDPYGAIAAKLVAGPGVSGTYGWCDAIMGLRAHYNRVTKEYVITQECAGFRIRENLYRWTPSN